MNIEHRPTLTKLKVSKILKQVTNDSCSYIVFNNFLNILIVNMIDEHRSRTDGFVWKSNVHQTIHIDTDIAINGKTETNIELKNRYRPSSSNVTPLAYLLQCLGQRIYKAVGKKHHSGLYQCIGCE